MGTITWAWPLPLHPTGQHPFNTLASPTKPLLLYLGAPAGATYELQPSGPCHCPCRGACWENPAPCPGGPQPPLSFPEWQTWKVPDGPGASLSWLGARRTLLVGCVGCTRPEASVPVPWVSNHPLTLATGLARDTGLGRDRVPP